MVPPNWKTVLGVKSQTLVWYKYPTIAFLKLALARIADMPCLIKYGNKDF